MSDTVDRIRINSALFAVFCAIISHWRMSISIRHYGILDGEQEITSGPQVEAWAGGLENYAFEENNGVTTVTVQIDVAEDHLDYFHTTWPKALNKLKELSEA